MLATARDHKRAFDGDKGPNTGGMGAVSPTELGRRDTQEAVEREIMRPFVSGMAASGLDFRGLLFPGLMMTAQGPRVLEFNCRFGDPETQTILPRLKSDLLPLLGSDDRRDAGRCGDGMGRARFGHGGDGLRRLSGKIRSRTNRSAALRHARSLPDVQIFHAGTRREDGEVVTAGGRVLAVTALGATVEAARARAYDAVGQIEFEGAYFRRDIALPAVGAKVAGH